jgi:hypothetical protein
MERVTLQEVRPPRGRRSRRRLAAPLLLLAAAAVAAVLLTRATDDPGVPSSPPGMGDLWSGRAALVLDKKWTSSSLGIAPGAPAGAYSGAHVEIVGDTWYLFNRRAEEGECAGRGRLIGTQVRASPDRGATWGPAAAVVAPEPGTPWACAATDGDAFFDARTGTWGYLYQCLGENGSWNGCYAERRGLDPLGPFTPLPPGENPVIPSGELWHRICDDAGDGCHRAPGGRQVAEEGTFDVFDHDGDAWWVAFHGYDGAQGVRGIARTATFRRGEWDVDGAAGTPVDAVLDAGDAAGWRETWREGGPIGAGAGSVLEDDGWHYQLAEVPDTDLACTTGQNWNLGLFRTRTLSATTWEQLPAGNPLVYSSRAPEVNGEPPPCNVEYPRLFEDPATGVTYLMYGRLSADPAYDAIYVYRLEWDRSLLDNGDFTRADTDGWRPLAGTSAQLAAERLPNGSPDGTPYLSFSCGDGACAGGQSIHQDVRVDAELAGEELAFGGTFRAAAGSGRLELAVHQLDEAGAVLDSASFALDVGETYARGRGELEVGERARRLRFELYPRTPGPLRADNLYLIPQDGCKTARYPTC